ncbi:phosphate ABC transporter substrate-binding protein PstS [Brachybacterium nesterenkovii]|uniref:Phosphate-binding protein n=1 Tax=Brachybacterium nesterenkovii TaxID=47847 RepID=A0A1X6X2E0_9MICO|nr:phosphate ABC transporter substrate-binding protein PstS [Brachybacterium nesterenkovii]SLM92752.1 Phosphate ABC transporter, periplasmic phosphate-binding protein PstS (TC 3.A.1.7.1) [Brachybacterium nesterenkovii]
MNVRHTKLAAAAALALTGGLALSACGGSGDPAANGGSGSSDSGSSASGTISGQLAGAGASSQEAAQGAWTQNFIALNPEAQVTYDSVGSGKGRDQFISGGVKFAGSDEAMKPEDMEKAAETCQGGTAMDIPVYISPIAVVYKLDGVDNLQLSPATVAGIFSGQITKWNDPAIVADNPDANLPDKAITPVHRSDKSGTTGNFTHFLSETAPEAWTAGEVEEWPTDGGQSGDGTSGLVSTVEGGDGTIGYADFSKAGNLGVAKIKIGEEYVAPSADGAAKAVEASPREEGREEGDIAVEIDRKQTDSGVYPLVLVSYLITCDTYEDQATADLVKGYASYVISEDGQKAAEEAAGSAPLTEGLRTDAQKSIDSIKAKA